MKKIKLVGIIVPALMSALTVTAFAAIPNGTVVLGSNAYDLNYANAPANTDEINQAVVNSNGVIYVKMFDGTWIDNITGKTIDVSKIPEVIYKKDNTSTIGYKAGDGDQEGTTQIPVSDTLSVTFPSNTTDIGWNNDFTVTFNAPIDKTSVNNSTVYFTDPDGDKLNCDTDFDTSMPTKLKVYAPRNGYLPSSTYKLVINGVKKANSAAVNNSSMSFTAKASNFDNPNVSDFALINTYFKVDGYNITVNSDYYAKTFNPVQIDNSFNPNLSRQVYNILNNGAVDKGDGSVVRAYYFDKTQAVGPYNFIQIERRNMNAIPHPKTYLSVMFPVDNISATNTPDGKRFICSIETYNGSVVPEANEIIEYIVGNANGEKILNHIKADNGNADNEKYNVNDKLSIEWTNYSNRGRGYRIDICENY